MNCPECGHEHLYNEVCAVLSGEDDNACFCTMSKQQIELACWQAEALAARTFIRFLELQFSWDGDTVDKYDVYFAARVNDEKESL